jgi:uncharacterized protein (DUF2062 family)
LKNDFDHIPEIIVIIFIALSVVIAIGTWWAVQQNPKITVDASYIDGVLTASSILYAFWVILIERKPSKNEKKKIEEQSEKKKIKDNRQSVIIALFFGAVLFLTSSVCILFLDALGEYPSVYAFMFITISFLYNAYMIALAVCYKFYKDV